MSQLHLSLKLEPNFTTKVLAAVGREVVRRLVPVAREVEAGLKPLLRRSLEESPTYQAMQPGGNLFHRIGNPDLPRVANGVVAALEKSVHTESFPLQLQSGGFRTGFSLRASRADFSDVLGVDGTTYTTTTGKNKGAQLPWLSWLLFEGTTPVIDSFFYADKESEASRTGKGLMIRSRVVTVFAIPPEYSGTREDNWIVRSLETLVPQVGNLFRQSLARHF